MDYQEFLATKIHYGENYGYNPVSIHDELFDFQKHLVEWSFKKGRCAIFADCGLGKSPIQLIWAENVTMKTNDRVLILAPLAVSGQTKEEADKFGVDAIVSKDGKFPSDKKIIITNYERLHYFTPSDFVGTVCDESSILKNFDGTTKKNITEFMRKMSFRLLCTATAAPNDYIELGTSSEALGELGYIDMLQRFFKANDNSYAHGGGAQGRTRFSAGKSFEGKFRFRGHAEKDFWRWMCSWSRALRKPSDLGFDDNGFILPELITREHVVKARKKKDGFLFDMPAVGLAEQREERRRTINERCELAAEIATNNNGVTVSWCHLNDEGDLLQQMIPGSVQVAGKDSDDKKEEIFRAFKNGEIKNLITKPTIAGFGLNWQHCNYQTFFPSHSFEQWYQAIRRSWRFGQKNKVIVDVISSEGERGVLLNMQRKQKAADVMFENLISHMNSELNIKIKKYNGAKVEVPAWV